MNSGKYKYNFKLGNSLTHTQPLFKLDPYFVTGFSDAEGCFTIDIYKTGWKIKTTFQIGLHQKDLALLKQIHLFFGGVGKIYESSKSCQFRVFTPKDLKIIIDHFDKYPLLTQKRTDFELFKKVVIMMKTKEDLTIEGLKNFVAIRASINWGLPSTLKAAFPGIVPIQRSLIVASEFKDPQWLAGFASGEGCFYIKIYKSKTKLGEAVQLKFQITQHNRDEQLMKNLIDAFGCGKVSRRSNGMGVDFIVTKFEDLNDKIIPFFDNYKIVGVKAKDFEDFKKVVILIKDKAHLTLEGLDQIRLIKSGMNKGRN